jgi:hypothetical protein
MVTMSLVLKGCVYMCVWHEERSINGCLGCRCVHAGSRAGGYRKLETHPKMRSGWAMKSVMRSSILLGSRTNVGKVTFERSMPTL